MIGMVIYSMACLRFILLMIQIYQTDEPGSLI